MPLRVIAEGTRCRWQLKGDTDNSYLSITVLLTHLKPKPVGFMLRESVPWCTVNVQSWLDFIKEDETFIKTTGFRN